MPKKTKWPALPTEIEGISGPIEVIRSPEIGDNGHMGTFNLGQRVIRISSGLKPEVAFCTLFHEVVEAALCDSGLHYILGGNKKLHKLKEAICDAIASALLAQFRKDNAL